MSRAELLRGRLEGGGGGGGGEGGDGRREGKGEGPGDRENAERWRQLRAKKERLMYTVERLALQKGQKVGLIPSISFLLRSFWLMIVALVAQDRQLRMSMSYKGVV